MAQPTYGALAGREHVRDVLVRVRRCPHRGLLVHVSASLETGAIVGVEHAAEDPNADVLVAARIVVTVERATAVDETLPCRQT